MATLTKQLINWYRNGINEQSNNAAKIARNNLLKIIKESDIAKIREKTISLVSDIVEIYGDNAKVLSCYLFDNIMMLEGSDINADFYDSLIEPDYIENNVRYKVNKVIDGDSKDFIKEIQDLVVFLVQRSAYENTKQNCIEKHVRYALVPTGSETCAFCFMLASRGFVYDSDTAEKRQLSGFHRHCDCKLIPSTDGKLEVYGYDPFTYEMNYLEARDRADSMRPSDIIKAINELAKEKGWDYMWGN